MGETQYADFEEGEMIDPSGSKFYFCTLKPELTLGCAESTSPSLRFLIVIEML